ncbi:MAG: aldose 1-epimerase family protein [Actinomycetota bacterium]|nr:aldose 1-epimerase family protein [Actinomycetota bacterium]
MRDSKGSGAPTGEQYAITGGDYEAVVVEGGGGLRSLTYAGRPLVDTYEQSETITGGRGQVLLPWPNRIRDGAYTFGGTGYQLALSEPDQHNATHGLVRWCSWRPDSWGREHVRLRYRLVGQSGYPWPLDLGADYSLSADGLVVTLSAENLADVPVPFAAGMHPYLSVGGRVDEAVLTLPAGKRQLVDERKLPTSLVAAANEYDFGTGRRIGDLVLDDAYTDLRRGGDGRAVVRLEGGGHAVELWLDESWAYVQVFTGDALSSGAREALAVEPMTAPADAFNSGSDLIELAPGQTWSGSFGIRAA